MVRKCERVTTSVVSVCVRPPTDIAPCTRQAPPPKWEKVLYTTQPFEDNYVDDTFLEQMKTNGALVQRSSSFLGACSRI